jgi:hypothetical protein
MIFDFLNFNPFHIECLLLASEVLQKMGEAEQSLQLLNRSIRVFESIWHTLFTPHKEVCCLQLNDSGAQPFFTAIFRYIGYLSRSGCARSALEMSKILHNMNPSDPMMIRAKIDHFAIRSGCIRWFVRLCEDRKNDLNFFFPNILFSYALSSSLLTKHDDQKDTSASSTSSSLQSSVPIAEEYSPSEQCWIFSGFSPLEIAILSFPSVVEKIATKNACDHLIELTRSDSFQPSLPPFLKNLITVYVELSADFWKAPDILQWLANGVIQTKERLHAGGLPQIKSLFSQTFEKQNYTQNAMFVADFIDRNEQLPEEAFQPEAVGIGEPIMNHGPAMIDISQAPPSIQASPLLMFLWSLAPWNLNAVPSQEEDDDIFIDEEID